MSEPIENDIKRHLERIKKQTKFAGRIRNMGKYIIAVCAPQNSGKTSTINNIWDLLPSYYSGSARNEKNLIPWSYKYEILGYTEPHIPDSKPIIRNRKTGVYSLGDNINQVKVGLSVLGNLDCDVIVCASRAYNWIKKAIDGILTTDFKEVFKHDEYPYQKIDLQNVKMLLESYEIIYTTPFILESVTPRSLKHIAAPFRTPVLINGINLDRLMAQNIVDLIERLDN